MSTTTDAQPFVTDGGLETDLISTTASTCRSSPRFLSSRTSPAAMP